MRITVLSLLTLGLLLGSCANEELEKLKVENQSLKDEYEAERDAVNLLMADINTIQSDLRDITNREGLLEGMTVNDAELAKTPQEQVVEEIGLIDALIQKNQVRIDGLEQKLKKADGKQYELERLIAGLKGDLSSKNDELEGLKGKLVELEEGFSELLDQYHEQRTINEMQDAALHKVYFAYGSKQELIEMNIADGEGGVLGVGKTWKLKDDFNKEYFTEFDYRQVDRLPLESKKVELITDHPSDSYELVEEEGMVKEIRILDPYRFWEGSRYLAVLVDS